MLPSPSLIYAQIFLSQTMKPLLNGGLCSSQDPPLSHSHSFFCFGNLSNSPLVHRDFSCCVFPDTSFLAWLPVSASFLLDAFCCHSSVAVSRVFFVLFCFPDFFMNIWLYINILQSHCLRHACQIVIISVF